MTDSPLSRVRAFQRAANPNRDYQWPAEEAANIGGVPLYFDDIEALASTDELDAVEVAIRRLREAESERDRLAARVAELEATHARCADLYVGGRGPAGVIEVTAFQSSGCDGCGCCTHDGCHRFADATCPTDSLGDSVCPCTEE
jgi:hypothetical protein